MKKTIPFIALMLGLPLLITCSMAMDAPMEQEPSSRKRTFSAMQETNTQEETTPEQPCKRHRGGFLSLIEQGTHNLFSCYKKVHDYVWSWLTPSPNPALTLDLWGLIYQSDRKHTHNLLFVCKDLHNRCWSLRTNIRLCLHGSDNTLEFIARIHPNLPTLTISHTCHRALLHKDYHSSVNEKDPGLNLLLFTNLQSLSLRRKGTATGEIISKLTNLKHLELPITHHKLARRGDLYINIHSKVSVNYYNDLKVGVLSLTQLDKLDLGSLPFQDSDMPQLQFLKSLSLQNNLKITDLGMAMMTNLTSLDLGDNEQVTHEGLLPLTNLIQLNVRESNNVNIRNLTSLTQLQQLSLCPVNTQGVRILKEAIPHLQIDGLD